MEEIIEWQCWEHHSGDRKHRLWFIAIGGLTLILIAIAVLTKNFLLAIIILVGGLTLIVHHAKEPRPITCSIIKHGVRLDDRLYPYHHLQSFFIDDGEHNRKVRLLTNKTFFPHLSLPLPDDQDAEIIRQTLLAFLPETRHDKPLIEAVVEFLEL